MLSNAHRRSLLPSLDAHRDPHVRSASLPDWASLTTLLPYLRARAGSLRVPFAVLCTLFPHAPLRAAEPEAAPTANVLMGSLAYQAPTNFEKAFYGGGGLVYTREYFVTARSALGIQAGGRFFPAAPWHFAFGYGLLIKHYVGDFGSSKSSGLYLKYGLLLQMNFLDGRRGSALGHDTLFALGYDRTSDRPSPVVEVGYHLTQVRGFDQKTIWWPYTEVAAGIRF